VSIDPAAQLRHELRTPLNHIIGYAEMLLEELQEGDKPDIAAGLTALRTDARQLLALLNEVLARGQTGPPDLVAARGTLGPPLERVRSAGEALRKRAAEIQSERLNDKDAARETLRMGDFVEVMLQDLRRGRWAVRQTRPDERLDDLVVERHHVPPGWLGDGPSRPLGDHENGADEDSHQVPARWHARSLWRAIAASRRCRAGGRP